MLVKIRNDDILVHSSAWNNPTQRFTEMHQVISPYQNVVHVPAILTDDIQKHPQAIEFIQEETKRHTMQPEVHGKTHINYKTRTRDMAYNRIKDTDPKTWTSNEIDQAISWVKEDIQEAKQWITETFKREPKYWYTPWGAEAPHLHIAANQLGLTLIGTKAGFNPIREVYNKLSKGIVNVQRLDGIEIFEHWWSKEWSRHNRLERICAAVSYGSWDDARKSLPNLFLENE